jgi:chemosensory pili system protein ChpA (sensor histidine kinase/response regulator)
LGVEAPEETLEVGEVRGVDESADLVAGLEPPPSLQSLVPDLPSADDLALPPAEDLAFDLGQDDVLEVPAELAVPELPEATEVAAGTEPAPVDEVAAPEFELDLGAFDAPAAPADLPTVEIPTLELPTVDEVLDDDTADQAQLPGPAEEPETLELSAEDFDLEFATDPGTQPEAEPEPEAGPGAEAAWSDDADVPPTDGVPSVEPEPELPADAAPEPVTGPTADEEESFKLVGPLRIAIPLFNIFLNEADEQSRRLGTELAEWALEPHRPMGETAIALAHSLAGNSGTVGFSDLSMLGRALEHALMRSRDVGHASDGEADLFSDAAIEIRRLLHQFAAGFLKPVDAELMLRLADHEIATSNPERDTESPELEDSLVDEFDAQAEPGPAPEPAFSAEPSLADEEDIDAVDALDHDLFPIFEEEADELLPQLRARLSDWVRQPASSDAPAACMRTLHTFKGGARLAGAMRVGELAHRLETEIERLAARDALAPADIEHLLGKADTMASLFERLRKPGSAPPPAAVTAPAPAQPLPQPELEADAEAMAAAVPDLPAEPELEPEALAETILDPLGETLLGALDDAVSDPVPPASAPAHPAPAIDWQRFTVAAGRLPPATGEDAPSTAAGASTATVRVRAPLLDRLVNQAGEVSITRARIESSMQTLQGSLGDLTDNLEKLRRHLRDIELQAETQISSRMEAAKASAETFDPLEMDRFTRFQEITRMMAESVNDVATVQRGLQRALQSSEDELAAQARLTRDLQDDLLRTRMVEFESLADRLYRVVRQAAKETGKSVRLDLEGGSIEVDRGVLERMVGPFEHLLRNSVAHGIEAAAQRRAAGKPETGTITITAQQEGNEVAVEVRDDGGGLDLARIRARALDRGLLAADASPSDDELAQMIFLPGFSTAESVSGLAGRGVGMDVVRSEVNAMGGRIETVSRPGQGTSFRLVLPLTTAVTQVVMLRFGDRQIAVPSTLVEVVRRAKADEIQQAYLSGIYDVDGHSLSFFWLGALLQASGRGGTSERSQTVVVMRSASQRVAVHVDEVVGNQEVVVKNLGPQLSRLPGLAGITLLPSGAVAMIYNPVALATVYGNEARDRMLARPAEDQPAEVLAPVALAPLIMVVDDSLTVRRVTQRLLVREGYRVVLAKDGMDALERLASERPALVLSDIEMPRMDGFDLVRNLRSDAKLADLPVIMITSRIAQKHRDYAAELGVEHYLGKPYAEDELLALVAQHVEADIRL